MCSKVKGSAQSYFSSLESTTRRGSDEIHQSFVLPWGLHRAAVEIAFREGNMRIDKFLKNSRLIKRRTVAKDACDQGRVFINDKVAKAGSEVNVGDTIHIEFGNSSVTVRVMDIIESARKETAPQMYEIIQ